PGSFAGRSSQEAQRQSAVCRKGMASMRFVTDRLRRGFDSTARMLAVAICFLFAAPTARADGLIDSPMYKMPEFPAPHVIRELPKGASELWRRALERPEADLKIKAADAFALAHRRGYKEAQAAIPALLVEFDRPDQAPAVRLAAAQSLSALDARVAAPNLFR